MNSELFAGKVALVTGSSRGIGRATALALARGGADVVINCVERDDLADEVSREIKHMNRRSRAFKADVSDFRAVESMVGDSMETFEHIDILVNNAGVGLHGNINSTCFEEWKRLFEVDLEGVFNCCKAVLPLMQQAGAGAVVNIGSIGAHLGDPFNLAYSAMKAGVLSLTRNLAAQEARNGIRVNAVSPGIVDTDLTRKEPPEALSMAVRMVPMGRMAAPEEVAAAVCFLASENASYITGEFIRVSGGLFV